MAPTRTMPALTIPPSPMLEVEQRGGGVDWNDPRIQSWTWDYRLVNTRYISAVTELYIAEKRLGVSLIDGSYALLTFRICTPSGRTRLCRYRQTRRPEVSWDTSGTHIRSMI